MRYGAPCIDKKNTASFSTDIKSGYKGKGGSKSAKKGKGKKVYYDGENCVEAKELDVNKCADHKTVVYEEGCAVVEGETEGCLSAEMCAQRHESGSGKTCPNCSTAGKLHACSGCPNAEKKRGLMADAW